MVQQLLDLQAKTVMKEIKKYTAEISTEGNGFLRIELDGGTIVPGIVFTSASNFAAVCSMLKHGHVYYEFVNENHNFISSE